MKKRLFVAALSVLLMTAIGLPAFSAVPMKMYWEGAAVDTTTILRANLDGSESEIIASCSVACGLGPLAIDKDAEKIYYIVIDTESAIFRANLDGSGLESVLNLGDGPAVTSLAVDAVENKMYWSEYAAIRRANQDGTGIETLYEGLTGTEGLSVDAVNGKLYWTNEDPAVLRRSNLDGSDVEDLFIGTGPFSKTAPDLATGKIYWVAGDTIRRANLDGSSPETLPVSLHSPVGLAVDSGAQQLYVGIPRVFTPPTAPSKILRIDPVTYQVVEILTGVGASELALDGGSSGDVPAMTGRGLAVASLLLLLSSAAILVRRMGASG